MHSCASQRTSPHILSCPYLSHLWPLINTTQTHGNKKLIVGLKAKNKLLLREAVGFYSQGISEKCSDNKLNSILYSNRAHVETLLGE